MLVHLFVTALRVEALCGMRRQASAFARPVVRPIRLASACVHQTGNMWRHRIRACVLKSECPMPMEYASAQVDACGMLDRRAASALAN